MSSKSSIKDFEVLNKLGQGSFGTVFKVRRKVDKNLYVMKIINISQMDRRGQQESINEVKILASLDSPYIVKYYDSFVEDKKLHIVMEYCDKGDLSQAIRNQMGRFLPENKIWKFFIQMCLGLEFIHSKKILHRDIKSMNVFLVRDDNIRIGDLGVAKVLANTAAFAHTMVGTPYYLSPELCEEKPYNVKSDVWALGCVLYELCTLKHPFDAINQGALILKIIKGTYIPISTTYSEELKSVVDLCLCKDYRKRLNITAILNRPGMKDRALSLNISIPNTSIWAAGGNLPGPARELNYVSPMGVIVEEEKAPAGRPGIKAASPARGIVKKESRPSEKEIRVPKVNEVEIKKDVRPSDRGKVDKPRISEPISLVKPKAPEPMKPPEPSKISEKPKVQEPIKPSEPAKPSEPKKPFEKAKVQEPTKPVEKPSAIKPQEKKDAEKPKPELNLHYNNIQFNPPKACEPRPVEAKAKQTPIKSAPKNFMNNAVNKSANVVKSSPKNEIQKVIKPGGPHFMPPSRPTDVKISKKDSNVSVKTEEEKEVQLLPDYKQYKKPSISMFKPQVIKIEQKEYDPIEKPMIDDNPYVFEELGETIDWNFTATGFTGKSFIPVIQSNSSDFTQFQVNYSKNVKENYSDEEGSSDELYYSSQSEEFNEGEETAEEEDLESRIAHRQKELAEATRLEFERKNEIIQRVGQKTFNEMYDFFKHMANVSLT